MAKLEIFVSGVFCKSGEDAYQIGCKYEDGEYVAASGDVFVKSDAEAALKDMQPKEKKAPAKKAAPKKAAPKK